MSSAIAAVAALALSAVSSSKIGVVVPGDDATSQAILAACPRLVVFPIDGVTAGLAATQIAAYRAACAGGTVIVQVGGRNVSAAATPPATLWPTVWLPQVQTVGTANVDGVEGPSEPLGTTAELASFWASFAQVVSGSSLLPIVGALPSGLPVNGGSAANEFCTTTNAVKALALPGFAWSYHARSSTMNANATTETSTTLAYQQIRTDCALGSVPLFITEAGPASRAWQASDSSWFTSLDAHLLTDGNVVGAALVQAGGADVFSLAPVTDSLVARLQNPTPGDGGVPDGGADGGGGGGVVPGPHPGPGGTLVPSNPSSGCSTGGPVLLMLALSPVLFLVRRRRR